MKVVLLAGGSATRMQPYSYFTEKSLLPLAGGKPIIRIIAERVWGSLPNTFDSDFEIIFCILGKYRDNFRHEFRDFAPRHAFSEKVEAIGTATHYYFAAEKEFHFDPEETVLIHYADALTELDYAAFLKEFESRNGQAMIAVTKNAQHDYSEVVIPTKAYDETGQSYHISAPTMVEVNAFHEKPKLTAPTWTGIALLKHRVMQEEFGNPLFGKRMDFAYDIWPKLVAKNILYAYLYEGEWLDVGNLHSYSKAVEKYRGGSLFV